MKAFVKIVLTVIVMVLAHACKDSVPQNQSSVSAQETSKKRNILFISIDDMNDWIEPYRGHPQTITSAMKALSEHSFVFTNAHAAAPLCNPSRVAILTGMDPRHSGVISNNAFYPFREHLPNVSTLFDKFNQAGYTTAVWGKIFHKKDGEKEQLDVYSYDYGRPVASKDNPKNELPDLTEKVYKYFDWGAFPDSISSWGEHQSANHVIAFLNKEHKVPFLAAVGMRLPHLPWNVPDEFMSPFDTLDMVLPPYLSSDFDDIPEIIAEYRPKAQLAHQIITENKKHKDAIKSYLAAIHYSDYELGRILEALKNSVYADNTVIVLWSDHGFHLGEKDWWRKNTLWERSSRVPLMISLPETKERINIDQVTSLMDLHPTLLSLCDLTIEDDVDGQNLHPLLNNPALKLDREVVATTNEAGTAIRSNEWRYIKYIDGSEELYHTAEDPNEFKNLVKDASAKEKLKEMRTYWYGVKGNSQ